MRRPSRRKGVRRRTALPGTPRRPTRPPRTASPQRLVETLQEALRVLREERLRIDERIEVIENALRALEASEIANPGGPRARAGSLVSYIEIVLAGGKPMSVKEITAAVEQAGYRSRNRTLAKSVGAALARMPGVEKVARGIYRRKP